MPNIHAINKEYYHNNEYDDLIKSELKLDNWVFLSEYIIFEPYTKRKFIIKKYIFEKTKWTLGTSIPDKCINKTFQELQEKYLIIYENFKTKYNVDIYPHIFSTITADEMSYNFKYCCNHDFLPNILLETDSFLEMEYLDLSEWRFSTPRERSSNAYFDCLNDYCSYIHNLKLCVAIDSHNYNIMVNRKTGKFKNIDIEDLLPPNHFIPHICWYSNSRYQEFSTYYVLRTDYVWSTEMFNKSFDYYKDLLEIICTDRIYIEEKPIYCTDDYKNLPNRI
jgi:hypothetical protein